MICKEVKDGYIVSVGTGIAGQEITESEYENILSVFANKPTAPKGYEYMLADSLEWVLVEADPEPEPEASLEEILDILTGGAS